MRTEIQDTKLYKEFIKALDIHDMVADDNPFVVKCCKIAEAYAAQQKPSSSATAEEIIESILESLGDPINIHNHAFEIRPYTVDHKTEWWIFHKEVASGEPLAQWLSKFATLHAQKIADKMVSERDDDVFDKMNCLVGYLERWWKNPQSYPPVELKSVINEAIEYLKSREK